MRKQIQQGLYLTLQRPPRKRFHVAETLDQFLSKIGQLGAASLSAATVGDQYRPAETPVEAVHVQPRPAVSHAHGARSRRYGSFRCDSFEQLNLAGPQRTGCAQPDAQ